MSDLPIEDTSREAAAAVAAAADEYLQTLDERLVRDPDLMDAVAMFDEPLPKEGFGALETLGLLRDEGMRAAAHSAGPRFFHFVVGGVTPAALGADWLTTLIDQNAYAWTSSPIASELERIVVRWLAELFELGEGFGGVLTTGTTMANFIGLATARQWWGLRSGRDIAEEGMGEGVPPILAGGHIHPSSVKAIGMLGMGRSAIERFAADALGATDLEAMESRLRQLDGHPAILVATAGEVNAGMFDPVSPMADLAERYDAWLHVDASFGAFARLDGRTRHLIEGLERADSIAFDGHKWLNVPYESAVAFLRDVGLLGSVFTHSAEYLPDADDPRPNFGFLGPEMSRRARALPAWASLRAYGRAGYARIVASCLDRAAHLGRLVDEAPDFERLAEVILNIVCFRYRPEGWTSDAELDRLNSAIGEALLSDGRVYAGTTVFDGKVALRPAVANWRTTDRDIELLVEVVRDLGRRLVAGGE